MELLCLDDCRKIVGKRLGLADFEVLAYEVRFAEEAGGGFIGASRILTVQVKKDGTIVELCFFVKTIPVNEYHKKNVLTANIFYKEAEFYKAIWPKLSKFISYKIAPTCYHSDPKKLLVFENLIEDGYRNPDPRSFFDLEHCEAIVKRLASLHAASFLFEKEINSTIDKEFPELMCDRTSWFKNEKGHPGYEHCQTGVRALGVVLDKYFPHVKEGVRGEVKILLASNPAMLIPSKNYRNSLTHSDLWANNFMFKYDDSNTIQDVILLDYQLFGYCPPSHDVFSMIWIVTDKQFRVKYTKHLARMWYDHFCENIVKHGSQPNEFLTWAEFEESASEAVPLALTNTAIFLHYILLPEEYLDAVFSSSESTKQFMEKDRSPIILTAMESDLVYRDRIMASLQDCVDYIEGKVEY